jgi:hypothetical protein
MRTHDPAYMGGMPLMTKCRVKGGDATGGSGDGDAACDDVDHGHYVCAHAGCDEVGIKRSSDSKQVCQSRSHSDVAM